MARSQGPRVGESVQQGTLGIRHSRGRGGREARIHGGAVRLHPIPGAIQVTSATGLFGYWWAEQAAGAGRVSDARAITPGEARRAHDGGHLRARDDRAKRARGRAAVGGARAGHRCSPADGVPVALSQRIVQHRASQRRAVQHCAPRDQASTRAQFEARVDWRTGAAVAAGVHAGQAAVRCRRGEGAEAGGVRCGV